MFHFVFDPTGAQNLNAAMDLDEALEGEVVLFADDYSVGPLPDASREKGRDTRIQWWASLGEGIAPAIPDQADEEALGNIVKRMEEEEFDQIWIWTAPNAKDVCGYYWLTSQLKEFAGRIYVVNLNNLPFLTDKGTVFYPISLSEISPREFVKAKKLARPVTMSEFETDPDEWKRLSGENALLRVLEGGKKIASRPEDHFDSQILQHLQPGFMKLSRVAGHFITRSSDRPNERFILWRLKSMIAAGAAEQQGDNIRRHQNAAGPAEARI